MHDSVQRNVPTLLGPFQFVPGCDYTYSLPLAVASHEVPIPPRSRAAWGQPIREEIDRLIDAMGDPTPDYVDNNLRVVAFLADAFPELDAARQARAKTFAEGALNGALTTLYQTTEPFTGQVWWTLGKTWRSHFADTDPPWGKDQERFDSEFYNGQALSALEASSRIEAGLAERHFDQAKQLYLYDQIFFDWATGSVLTQATGDTAAIDGIGFAFEGMQAMARLARRMGDDALCTDALYRAARQQAALHATWQQAAWVQRWNYAVGHVSGGRLAATDVNVAGPIDSFVEEYGAAALQFESFWQCTCFLFYANRPQVLFFQRYGLVERIRAIEYTIMPTAHPSWTDGNAIDPHAENGQDHYGASWTAAHLMVRARLFGDDPTTLFGFYEASKKTAAASTWYTMLVCKVAGPLMLALLEGNAGSESTMVA